MGRMSHVNGHLKADGIYKKAEEDREHHYRKKVNPSKTLPHGLSYHKDGRKVHGRPSHQHHKRRSRREALHDKGCGNGNAARGANVHGNCHNQDHKHLEKGLGAEAQEKLVRHRHLDERRHHKAYHQTPANVLDHLVVGVPQDPPDAVSAFNLAGTGGRNIGIIIFRDKTVYK